MDHLAPVFSVDVRNFALLNYRVPAELVQRHLPARYELELFDEDCFVTATCFCNGGFRPAALPFPRLTFDESTFRTYVTHKGRRGVYFFGRYLSNMVATVPQRLMAKHTYQARFDVRTAASEGGYHSYSCAATSDMGDVSFVITAGERPGPVPPFPTADAFTQFFTYRLHGFFTTSLGYQGHMPVDHPRMQPWSGTLIEARLDLFEELGILDRGQATSPHSILVQEEVPFTLYAPRPLR